MGRRATAQLADLREEYGWVERGSTALRQEPDGTWAWWTFAGLRANTWLAACLAGLRDEGPPRRNLKLRLSNAATHHQALDVVRTIDLGHASIRHWLSRDAMRGLKFSEALREPLALEVIEARLDARAHALAVASAPCDIVPGTS